MKSKILVLSSSNGLIKNGLCSGLSEKFDVDNKSIGASPVGAASFVLAQLKQKPVNAYSAIILDFSINDDEYLRTGWLGRGHYKYLINRTYEALSKSGIPVYVLLMPLYPYLDDEFENRGVVAHVEASSKFNFKLINAYKFVAGFRCAGGDPNDLFLDRAHLSRFAARKLGKKISDYIYYRSGLKEYEFNFEATPFFNLSALDFNGANIVKRFSQVYEGDCIRVSNEIEYKFDELTTINGVIVDANSKGILSFEFDGQTVIKNIYSGALTEGKLQVKFLPFKEIINTKKLIIKTVGDPNYINELGPYKEANEISEDVDVISVLCSEGMEESVFDSVEGEVDGDNFIFSSWGLELFEEKSERDKFLLGKLSILSVLEKADYLRECAQYYRSLGYLNDATSLIEKAKKERPWGETIVALDLELKKEIENRLVLFSNKKGDRVG